MEPLTAPMPYFGGKRRIAAAVWERFGDVPNFVEPFAGSLAVLLARPHDPHTETVNDADGMVANFWRAVLHDADAVAEWADWPVNEADLYARHLWLVQRGPSLVKLLEADPDNYDAKIAGWWLWGICQWIGSGWCSGAADTSGGPGGEDKEESDAGRGVRRQRPHLGSAGMGVHRQRPHLGDAGMGVHRKRPHLGPGSYGSGYLRGTQHIPATPDALDAHREHLLATMRQLQARLRRVRVCCGDWTRVLGPSPTTKLGITAVFLDPPYAQAERQGGLYGVESEVSAAVREWAIAHGDDPLMRIALCGYDTEHVMPATWERLAWKARGGYGSQGEGRGRENAKREVVWFSPHCLKPAQDLFGWAGQEV